MLKYGNEIGLPTYSQTLRYSAVYLLRLVGNAYRLPTRIVRYGHYVVLSECMDVI